MLKKNFHKILLLLMSFGITSLQAAHYVDLNEGKNDVEETAIAPQPTVGYYNDTLKRYGQSKVNNRVAYDDLEDEKEYLKENHIAKKLKNKQGAIFFMMITSSSKSKEFNKFFFFNRDPNEEQDAIKKVNKLYRCHVIGFTKPMLSPHVVFQVLGWMEQNARIYTPVFMHASCTLCITCHEIVGNLFNLNMPTNAKGCGGDRDVALEKVCPLAQQYINSGLTLALAQKILLPKVRSEYKDALRKTEDKLKYMKEKIKRHLAGSIFIGHTNYIRSLAATNDNKYIVSGSGDSTIRIWELKSGKEVDYSPLKGHTAAVYSVEITSDNKYIVSGSVDNCISIWDLKTGAKLGYSPLQGHTRDVRSVTVTQDNKYIVSGGGHHDNTIRIWAFKRGKEVGYSPLTAHTSDVNSVAVTKDNKYIISGSSDNTIRIWDLKTGKELDYSPLKGHIQSIRSVVITKDNKYIVSGSYDRTIRIWDLQRGKEVGYSPLRGHTNIVWSVAVTSDNKYIVSGSHDRTIRIWDFNTGKQLPYSPLKGHITYVLSVAVTADNEYILSGSEDGIIRIWDFKLLRYLNEDEEKEDNEVDNEVFDID